MSIDRTPIDAKVYESLEAAMLESGIETFSFDTGRADFQVFQRIQFPQCDQAAIGERVVCKDKSRQSPRITDQIEAPVIQIRESNFDRFESWQGPNRIKSVGGQDTSCQIEMLQVMQGGLHSDN